MTLYQINPNWTVFEGEELVAFNIATGDQYSVTRDSEEFKKIIEIFQDPVELEEAIEDFQNSAQLDEEYLRSALDKLKDLGIVEEKPRRPESLNEGYCDSYGRQINFMSEFEKMTGKKRFELQEGLKDAHITILGLGTLGQWIIMGLLSAGVGNLRIVDFDTVEERNLGRHPFFKEKYVGEKKTEVVKKEVEAMKKEISVETKDLKMESVEDVKSVVKGTDFVVQSCDFPRYVVHRWMTEACIDLDIPNIVLHSTVVGPINIPGQTPCYGCLEQSIREGFPNYEGYVEDVKDAMDQRYPEMGVRAPVAGTIAAREIVHHQIGALTPRTYDNFIRLHPFSLEITEEPVDQDENCDYCGE